ncbi:MAG: hypothetical protein JWM16_5556 [Verrucomicrobiales bacterium]|nr:hypothetical protein [Verrucomicrobiales bacterium]
MRTKKAKEIIQEPQPVKLSAIFKHVLETGTPYPVPLGAADSWDVDYDLHPDIGNFDERHLCTISKSDFAKRNDVAASQVSRWISAGMPIASDGERLPWGDAAEWLDRYEIQNERRRQEGWR